MKEFYKNLSIIKKKQSTLQRADEGISWKDPNPDKLRIGPDKLRISNEDGQLQERDKIKYLKPHLPHKKDSMAERKKEALPACPWTLKDNTQYQITWLTI